MPPFSLTEHLLSLSPTKYASATQHAFLLAAAEGRLSKDVLSTWLANDRLYLHAYIKAAGRMLTSLDLPPRVPDREAAETQLVDWFIEALQGVRREERLFLDVAGRYGLRVDLRGPEVGSQDGVGGGGEVGEGEKGMGLVLIEEVFRSVGSSTGGGSGSGGVGAAGATTLPWLEGAVTFWGTERCYLDAWSWAKSKQGLAGGLKDGTGDADGGALRKEFIPNWSSPEFARFVGQLGSIIDHAVVKVMESLGEGIKEELVQRVEGKWMSLLAAEAAFWPSVE